MRCAFCHDDLVIRKARRCDRCGTVLHPDCRAGLRVCPTLGCGARIVVPRFAPEVVIATPFARSAASALVWAVLVLIAPCVVTGVVQAARIRDATRRAEEVDTTRLRAEGRALLAAAQESESWTQDSALACSPYLREVGVEEVWVSRWAVDLWLTGSLGMRVGLTVLAAETDPFIYDRSPQDGYCRYRRLAPGVYIHTVVK